jgi:superfamily II DNA or RNA helicase/HKD family nuclease
MSQKERSKGGDLFIVDNSDSDWKVRNYLYEWADIASRFDIATGFFEIGALLSLDQQWQKLENIRILMGDEVSARTQKSFLQSLENIKNRLDQSIETEKESNDFLTGAPAIVEALRKGQIHCRIYNKDKFHAKAYITHAKHAVIGPSALVGSSNFTYPGLTQNVELNVQLRREVEQLQEWYEKHWKDAQEVTPEILKVIERHTRDYTPFEVYARSLQEYFKSHETSANDWEKSSKMYNVLARYQQDGYHSLLKIGNKWDGALLCDGVGLGKTFIGLMLIERLVKYDGKRVALFVPKAARIAVWESKIKRYLPELLDGFYSFRIYNHTDLSRERIRFQIEQIREQADVVIIDEAHHFRNTGIKGEKDPSKKSRYWQMYDVCEGKQVYMLTATPINNRLTDLQHMLELFTRNNPKHFEDAPLGIHSLAGHIRRMENALKAVMHDKAGDEIEETDLAEAQQILSKDELFKNLVVQRSRSYVKKSMAEKGGEIPFPNPSAPQVVEYSVKQTYGKLLRMVEDAFNKEKPLFSLTMYYPWEFYLGSEEERKKQAMAMQEGRQKQVVQLIRTSFLKRFESSVKAFEFSCRTLMKKLIAFYQVHAETKKEKDKLEKWLTRHKDITGHDPHKQHILFGDDLEGEMIEEDIIEPEFFESAREDKLKKDEFDLHGILEDTLDDLDTLIEFLKELQKFQPKQDKKLTALKQLLKSDPILKEHKCLIFTEFMDTAKYVYQQLLEEGYADIEEIDSTTNGDGRELLIKRFSPYYNESSSGELARAGHSEIRILISTDVLSEGLNLQDATRLINYDLHWNPVRLMQRIGRTDRRMDTETEARMIGDHPEMAKIRGTIQYYNFLPPEELNVLLSLYNRVTHKTLRISKTFGIEGGKLLRHDDDYEMLKDFNAAYEGEETQLEKMHLEYQQLLKEFPELEEKLKSLPGKVFSGKESPNKDAKAVFFCYGRPGRDAQDNWSIEAGDVCWYLYDIQAETIIEDATKVIDIIRSEPATPRKCVMETKTLGEIRKTIEKHIKNTYLKKIQAPIGVKPKLIAWMEIN